MSRASLRVRLVVRAYRLAARVATRVSEPWLTEMGDAFEERLLHARARGRGPAFRIVLLELGDLLGLALDRVLRRGRHASNPGYEALVNDGRLTGGVSAHVSGFARDLRIGARSLSRTPLITLALLVTLALGIGSATAIFSVVESVLLRPLGYRSAEQLVTVWTDLTQLGAPARAPVTPVQIVAVRERTRLFESFVVTRALHQPLTGKDGTAAEQVKVTRTSANFFDFLGVQPILGRGFAAGEDAAGAPALAVLSHTFWERRFGGDPGVIGSDIYLDGEATKVIGVMPKTFRFATHMSDGLPQAAALWTNLRIDFASMRDAHSAFGFGLMGRVRDGVTLQDAIGELQSISKWMKTEYGYSSENPFNVIPLQEDLVGGLRRPLLIVQLAALLLLAIVATNLAMLLTARIERRSHEIAVSRAIGARTGVILRGILAESTVLAMIGSLAGLLVGYAGVRLFVGLAPADLPRRDGISLSLWSVAFTGLAVALLALFSAIPAAWHSRESRGASAIRQAGTRTTSQRARKLWPALAVVQLSLAVMLVLGSVLLVRTMRNLLAVQPGYATEGVLLFDVQVPMARATQPGGTINLTSRIQERLAAVPGVSAAGVTTEPPLNPSPGKSRVSFLDSPLGPEWTPALDFVALMPGTMRALGMKLLEGRDFATTDHGEAQRVAIIDEVVAKKYFPGGSAVGQRVTFPGYFGDSTIIRVIGVVEHARLYSVDSPDDNAQIYVAFPQMQSRGYTVALRSSRDPESLLTDVRAALHELEPRLPIANVRSIEDAVRSSLTDRRLSLLLVSVFGAIALLLSTLGVYAVLAGAVTARRHEIGVRMALGADASGIRKLIMNEGGALIGVGILLGTGAGVVGMRLMRSLMFEVHETDPRAILLTALIIGSVGAIATLVPALRAAATPPTTAQRGE